MIKLNAGIFCLLGAFSCLYASAKQITIEWNLSSDTSEHVTGYMVYLIEEQQMRPPIDVGLTNTHVFPDLALNGRYLIYVTAYNSLRVESDPSVILKYPETEPCVIAATPSVTQLTSARSIDSFFITTASNCSFLTTTDSSWLSVDRIDNVGTRIQVSYVARSNRIPVPRLGFISTGGQVFSIFQEAGLPEPPLLLKRLSRTGAADEDGVLELTTEVEQEDGEIRFQWFKDGFPIHGATNSAYVREATQTDAGEYEVDVSNDFGTIRDGPSSVIFYQKPRFKDGGRLVSRVVALGDLTFFSVNALGTDLDYIWTKNGSPLGVNGSAIILRNIRTEDLGIYQVVVSNRLGSIQSQSAYLTTRELEQALGRIRLNRNQDGSLLVQGEGLPGSTYRIEVSQDLIVWRLSDSVVVAEGGRFTIDSPLPALDQAESWFVRTVRQPPSPSTLLQESLTGVSPP